MPVRSDSRGCWGPVLGCPFPPLPHPICSVSFQWPAPADAAAARVLLEPPWHTHRTLSTSHLHKEDLSQLPIALGMWKPSCLALKPGHILRCTFHSRFHCLLTLRLGFCPKLRLCLASFPSGPASPLPYQLLLGDVSPWHVICTHVPMSGSALGEPPLGH